VITLSDGDNKVNKLFLSFFSQYTAIRLPTDYFVFVFQYNLLDKPAATKLLKDPYLRSHQPL